MTTYYVGKIYELEVDDTVETERKYYTLGGGRFAVREDGVLNWTLSDHLGSASISTHADGSWRGEIAYTPFGEMRESRGMTLTDYRYTGQRLDAEVGLYFYQARWMDPVLGRFTQADTIIPDPGNPLSLDRYAYTSNNPVKYIDPSGHKEVEAGGGGLIDPSQPPTGGEGGGNPWWVETLKNVSKNVVDLGKIFIAPKIVENWWKEDVFGGMQGTSSVSVTVTFSPTPGLINVIDIGAFHADSSGDIALGTFGSDIYGTTGWSYSIGPEIEVSNAPSLDYLFDRKNNISYGFSEYEGWGGGADITHMGKTAEGNKILSISISTGFGKSDSIIPAPLLGEAHGGWQGVIEKGPWIRFNLYDFIGIPRPWQ